MKAVYVIHGSVPSAQIAASITGKDWIDGSELVLLSILDPVQDDQDPHARAHQMEREVRHLYELLLDLERKLPQVKFEIEVQRDDFQRYIHSLSSRRAAEMIFIIEPQAQAV